MEKTKDQPENNASNRTVKVQPDGKAGNGQSTIRVSGAFSAHIFSRKREIDDLLVSKKLSAYTSGDLESSPELPVNLPDLRSNMQRWRNSRKEGRRRFPWRAIKT